jgi:hypothetical protein
VREALALQWVEPDIVNASQPHHILVHLHLAPWHVSLHISRLDQEDTALEQVDRNLALQTVLLLEEHEEGLILLDTKCLLNQAEDGLEEGVVVVDALDCLPASR